MSIEKVAAALPRRGITPSQKLVLIGIANHDGDGGAWPSVETLAAYAEVKPRQVQYIIRQLVDLGLVSVEANAGGTAQTRKDRRTNRYRLHLDGVQPTAPGESDGVQSDALRGAVQRADGVQPTAPEPSLNHPEPSARIFFEKFWVSYSRKIGKPAAMRAWNTAIKRDGIDVMRSGFKAWMNYWRDEQTPAQFIPHPATWLNQARYNDEPTAITEGGKKITAQAARSAVEPDLAFGKAGM